MCVGCYCGNTMYTKMVSVVTFPGISEAIAFLTIKYLIMINLLILTAVHQAVIINT